MDVRIALLGAGFMGSAHARAYTSIPALYGPGITPVIAWVIDADAALAERAARDWGAQRWGTRWQDAIADPSITVTDVCLPPSLHAEIVTAAAEAGHAIYCEKPLTTSAGDALALTEFTEARGLPTMIGFNLRWAPAIRYLRDLIASGRLGTIYQFTGHFLADWAADPATWDWRLSRTAAGQVPWRTSAATSWTWPGSWWVTSTVHPGRQPPSSASTTPATARRWPTTTISLWPPCASTGAHSG